MEDAPASLSTSHAAITSGAPAGSSNLTAGPLSTAPFKTSEYNQSSSISFYSNSTCVLRDPYCSLEGSDHALDDLRDICVIWDRSCWGNSALAPQNYWHYNLSVLTSNRCFLDYSPDCTKNNAPGRSSALAEFKNWMRGPQ